MQYTTTLLVGNFTKKKSLKFGIIQYDILGLIEHGSLWVTFSCLKKFRILTIIFPVFHFKFNNFWKLFKADFPKNEKNLKNEKIDNAKILISCLKKYFTNVTGMITSQDRFINTNI